MQAIIVALIAAGVPSITTGIVASLQSRRSKRTAAKQSILIWIMHDRLMHEQSGILPKHYEQIMAEYEEYHQNGGNGIVTNEVEQYKAWIAGLEKKND